MKATNQILEAQVSIAAVRIGCIALRVQRGFVLLQLKTGKILDGFYDIEFESGEVSDTLLSWSGEDVLKLCAEIEEGLNVEVCEL